jgi:hypothetical protein
MFNAVQIEYLELCLSQVESFLEQMPEHPLALADVSAIESAMEGEITQHFKDFLESGIEQMEEDAPWSLNSRDQINAMRSILKTISK